MRTGRRFAAFAVAAGVGVGMLAGCGGSSSPSPASTPTPTVAETKALIKTNWEKFFDAKTPQADRLALLQNADAFKVGLRKAAKQPGANTTTAKVLKVEIDSPSLDPLHPTAHVTYNLYVGGSRVIHGGVAEAIYDGGTWKVSQSAFCGLIGQIVSIPACKA